MNVESTGAGGVVMQKTEPERPFIALPYPGIVRVTCPLPFPGLNHVHVYLAEGPDGGLVLIDTTLGWEDSLHRIEQAVAALGRRLEDLSQIVLTHAHPDHVGLAAHLQDVSGAEVLCHPIAEQGLVHMSDGEKWRRVGEHYTEHGWSGEGPGRHSLTIRTPDRISHLKEGDRFELAGAAWDVYWTPGHEWGHIVLFAAADRTILCGDTLLGKITPHIGYTIDPPDPLGQFLESLEQLEALDPSLVLPGHGRVFEEGAERARATKAHHIHRLRRIGEVLVTYALNRRRSDPPGLSALDIAHELFGRELMHFVERLAVAETLAHLEHLRLRDDLVRDKVDGVWRYGLPRRPIG